MINYKSTTPASAGSVLNASLSSSFSTLASPNPFMSSPLAGYRGRSTASHFTAHPIDGSLLSRLQAARDDDDES